MMITKTHITALTKVRNALAHKQKMNGAQLILCVDNCKKFEAAEAKINDALNILHNLK
jgi:hypothetical protein